MPTAITAIAKLVHPLAVVVRFFTADDGYHLESNPRRRSPRRFRRGLNG